MLGNFINFNRKLCNKLAGFFPQASSNIFTLYERVVTQYMNDQIGQIVIDVGGGKSCPFAAYRDNNKNSKIIALDVSLADLQENSTVNIRVVSDIISEMPLRQNSVDLMVSRSVLEHLTDVEGFIANSQQVLKNTGYMIHLFPSKFAPFAMINQILPKKLSKKLLYSLRPEVRGIGGFPALYDRCYYSAILSLLDRHGFKLVDVRVSYYQAMYFSFFAPLFLAIAFYEMIIQLWGWKNLGAYVLVVARKESKEWSGIKPPLHPTQP
jgi:ubiquinone/menaquinone biosynthesis C-methylase UbiE